MLILHDLLEKLKAFKQTRIIMVTDSWFGNNGLWKPLCKKLGRQFHMISRLRSNNNVFGLPDVRIKNGPGPFSIF